MAGKRKIKNESWESKKALGGKFTKICDDMQDSDAWHNLALESQGLYLYLKKKYTGNNELELRIFNKDIRILGKNKATIYKYVDDLISKGFIKVVFHGKTSRKPNIYGFCDEWKWYGTKDFYIHPNNERLTKKNLTKYQ